MKYGQTRQPKDLKNKPQDEFITGTSNNLSDAAEELGKTPKAPPPDEEEAREIDEEGLELKRENKIEPGPNNEEPPKMGT